MERSVSHTAFSLVVVVKRASVGSCQPFFSTIRCPKDTILCLRFVDYVRGLRLLKGLLLMWFYTLLDFWSNHIVQRAKPASASSTATPTTSIAIGGVTSLPWWLCPRWLTKNSHFLFMRRLSAFLSNSCVSSERGDNVIYRVCLSNDWICPSVWLNEKTESNSLNDFWNCLNKVCSLLIGFLKCFSCFCCCCHLHMGNLLRHSICYCSPQTMEIIRLHSTS